jgi:hypothetical protein
VLHCVQYQQQGAGLRGMIGKRTLDVFERASVQWLCVWRITLHPRPSLLAP